jgi:TPR repeat protein
MLFAYILCLLKKNYRASEAALGYFYEKGLGVAANLEEAIALYRRAVASNDPKALIQLAKLTYLGQGGLQENPTEAATLLQRALRQDSTGEAASLYGFLAASGIGIGVDLKQAQFWLHSAAHIGVKEAQTNLGLLYRQTVFDENKEVQSTHREKADDHFVQASRYLGQAAEQGLPLAQIELAALYLQGDGVSRDENEAIRLLTSASKSLKEILESAECRKVEDRDQCLNTPTQPTVETATTLLSEVRSHLLAAGINQSE